MKTRARTTIPKALRPFPIIHEGMPLLYEDDDEGEMGEVNVHSKATDIVNYGVTAHLEGQPELQVLENLNLYYSVVAPLAYISPDGMVVEPAEVDSEITPYRIGVQGPAPCLTWEVLSARTAQQRDLDEKVRLYAQLGVREYLLIDPSGCFLEERLLLKRLRPNRTWKDQQDPDGGITSRLGFRIILEEDGLPRVLNATTGNRYARPGEAEAEACARRQAEQDKRQAERRTERVKRQAKRQAEQAKHQTEEAQRQAEEANRRAELAERLAEQGRRQTEEAQRQTEEVQRQAEEVKRRLEAEIARLRANRPEGT